MVAYEVLHTMKASKKGRLGNMAIKLDMSKAYDRIEWSFLEGMMERMGFYRKWIDLVMKCVSVVSYVALINGKPGSKIQPSRGLRQGDPLSPYLFILCAEGLSSLLNQSDIKGITKGITVSRVRIRVNHLLFADDCILFGSAKTE
ncbi:secreted RxLR effector protein 78-like [Juglans regia]|uniref:Secreted RxLR effector protein 78-like n=1 Tax=Juglans regia TaxID=51240 RepID=A0A6P9ETY4_JUGRE|nr:secreted RxLR effector protein 78-like [Juglans regia]